MSTNKKPSMLDRLDLSKTIFKFELKTENVNFELDNLSFIEVLEKMEEVLKDNPEDDYLQTELKEMFESRDFGFRSMSQGTNRLNVSARYKYVITEDFHTCWSRMNNMGPWVTKENIDTWNTINKDRICSFCGSLHPEDMFKLIEERGINIIEISDKFNKLYITRPEVPNASFGSIKTYTFHLDSSQVELLNQKFKEANVSTKTNN